MTHVGSTARRLLVFWLGLALLVGVTIALSGPTAEAAFPGSTDWVVFTGIDAAGTGDVGRGANERIDDPGRRRRIVSCSPARCGQRRRLVVRTDLAPRLLELPGPLGHHVGDNNVDTEGREDDREGREVARFIGGADWATSCPPGPSRMVAVAHPLSSKPG